MRWLNRMCFNNLMRKYFFLNIKNTIMKYSLNTWSEWQKKVIFSWKWGLHTCGFHLSRGSKEKDTKEEFNLRRYSIRCLLKMYFCRGIVSLSGRWSKPAEIARIVPKNYNLITWDAKSYNNMWNNRTHID